MDEFFRKHDKPRFPSVVTFGDFKNPAYWEMIVRRIPPLIRKLAEYYHIPAYKYPMVRILFNDDHWEEWDLVCGRRNKLGPVTGGTYNGGSNTISLNPYIYLFEGGMEFLSVLYHELAHWIIEHVDYLKEEVYDEDGNMTFHLIDFSMVLDDIYDPAHTQDHWDDYRSNKGVRDGEYTYMKNKQALDFVNIVPIHNEFYRGSLYEVDAPYCMGLGVF